MLLEGKKYQHLDELRESLAKHGANNLQITKEIVIFKNNCHDWLKTGRPEAVIDELKALIGRIKENACEKI